MLALLIPSAFAQTSGSQNQPGGQAMEIPIKIWPPLKKSSAIYKMLALKTSR